MEKLVNKLFHYQVSQFKDRDEYQKNMIYQIYAKADILISYVLNFIMMAYFMWDKYNGVISVVPILLGLPLIIKEVYVRTMMKKYKLIKLVYYHQDDYQQAIKNLQHRAMIGGMLFFIVMLSSLYHLPLMITVPISLIATLFIVYGGYQASKKDLKLITTRKR